jgi:hypothetical protein
MISEIVTLESLRVIHSDSRLVCFERLVWHTSQTNHHKGFNYELSPVSNEINTFGFSFTL